MRAKHRLALGCALALGMAWPAAPAGATWPPPPARDTAQGPASTQLPSSPFELAPQASPAEAAWAELWRGQPGLQVLDPGYLLPFTGERVDLCVQAQAFVGQGEAWWVELGVPGGRGEWQAFWRHPASGQAHRQGPQEGLQVVLQAPPWAEGKAWDLRVHGPSGAWRLRVVAGQGRLSWGHLRGPRSRQRAGAWGHGGALAVRLRGQAPARRAGPKLLVVGGDFLYERIEDLVRFYRCQGLEAWGLRPGYRRPGDPGLEEMARQDAPALAGWLRAWGVGPWAMEGLCLGGVMARAYEAALRPSLPPLGALGTVGAPHLGAPLADDYNRSPALQRVHQAIFGGASWAQYHDSEAMMRAFNQAVPLPPALPTRFVGLDARGRRPEAVYVFVDPAIRVQGWVAGRGWPWAQRTDGMLPLEHQSPTGRLDEVWPVFHKGMLNLGGSARDFDAYAAHLQLAKLLLARAQEGP